MSIVHEADRLAFLADGVVALRGVLPIDLVAALDAPVERALANEDTTTDMTALGAALTGDDADGDRGRFRSGVDHWRHDDDLLRFATASPLPELIAALLDTRTLFLYEDSVLAKEPNTLEPTVFHQDHPYFSVDGEAVCTTWIPLDPVTRDTGGMGYVRGSHRDDTRWRPNLFVTRDAIPGAEGEDVPDLHADPGDADIVWLDAEPGDVIVHHARTLHGAGPNHSTSQRRRAISIRYCGEGVTFRRRALTPKPHHETMSDGDPLREPEFPQAWPATVP
jgi:ectoine hydroxylase-related dioxygenase (phytanoyl-CoA dioxygenase family)